MAIPNGYTKIEANKLYENVEYYIDVSVTPQHVISNITTFPYLGELGAGSSDGGYLGVVTSVAMGYGAVGTIIYSFDNSRYENIENGVVTDYPTLNINLTTSPDWLYVKTAPDYSGVKKVNITDENGNEFSFDLNKVQERKTVTITESGSYSVDPDEGYDGIAGADITVDIEVGTGLAEAATEADMTNLAATNDVGYIARYSGDTTENYENGRLYVLVEETTLITFDAGATTYGYLTAEEGMTWAEWCESDYNTYSEIYTTDGSKVYCGSLVIYDSSGTAVAPTDEIIADYSYTVA